MHDDDFGLPSVSPEGILQPDNLAMAYPPSSLSGLAVPTAIITVLSIFTIFLNLKVS